MPHRLFIDESGNTGRDIYDLQQPLLTYAGLWLDPQEGVAASAELDRLVGIHHLQRRGELNGKTILNSRSGRQVVRDLLGWLKAEKISATVIALEKSFMAAAVLVEDCTDLAYNDAYDSLWTWDTKLKEPLAERIARNAPPEHLGEAWRARHGTDKQAFIKAYTSLLFALSLSTDDVLSREAKQMQTTKLEAVWAATSESRGSSDGYSPNLSVFTTLLMNAEQHAEARSLEDVELIHDEQQQYKLIFEGAWTAIRGNGVDQARVTLPNQNEVIFGLKHLTKFRFADSATSFGIQLADFVASALRVALQENATSIIERSQDYLPDLQALLLAQLAAKNTPFVIGSESWQLKTMSHMLGRDPRFLSC